MGALSKKNIVVCYLWWFFLGLFGAHRFYLRKWCTAVIWLLTFGVFTIGWFVDLFLIPGMVESYNYVVEGQKAELLRRSGVAPPTVGGQPGPVQNVYVHSRPANVRDAGVGGNAPADQVAGYPRNRTPSPPGYELRPIDMPDVVRVSEGV